MKDLWADTKKKRISNKKIILIVLFFIVILAFILTMVLYKKNENVKNWIDKNILKKEIMQEQAIYIELENENSQSYAYSQYIGVLSNNNFDIYNLSGNKEETLNLEITTPIFNSKNRFLVVAEKDGQKAYMISNKNIEWEKKVEGNISQIYVNKNGYVAIVVTNTSCKTVIEMYNPEGEGMFKTYLPTTRVADVSISNDNKYLAVAEIDTSGTLIQSFVKIISVTKSQEDPSNSIEQTYKSEGNKLVTNVEYEDKNKLLCMYTDAVTLIDGEKEEIISENKDKKTLFSSIELNNSCVTLEEKSSGLFTADSVLKIINSESKEEKEYVLSEVAKEMYVHENIVAINLGTELEIVNKEGWLIKKYISNQEITNVILSNEVVAIVYRNRIEIVKI